jgi:drug/metabolite transporter (DMT)-like permease
MPHSIALHHGREAAGGRPDAATLVAFAATAVFAGGNAVAIRLGYAELAPYWGAAVRFLAAAAILLLVVAAMRLALPGGRALAGVVVYGALNFGLTFMFAYRALTEVTAGTAMVVMAIVPLLTLILAVVQRVERFHLRGLVGALLAVVGVALVFRDSVGVASLSALLALLGASLSMAEVNIVVKKFPRVHPVVESGLGMAVGGAMLLAVSLALGEPRVIPVQAATQLSLLYLIVFGSIGVFVLYLLVLSRWTATGASYVLLIAPLVTIALGVMILGEAVSAVFVVGGALVLAGVYVGAFHATASPAPRGNR